MAEPNSPSFVTSANVKTLHVNWPQHSNSAVPRWYVDKAIAAVSEGGGGSSVTISDTAPPSPEIGDLWWDSDSGNTYIWYTDANSSQWVQQNTTSVVSGSGGSGIPEAPVDSNAYGRKSAAWIPVLMTSGDVVDGGNF